MCEIWIIILNRQFWIGFFLYLYSVVKIPEDTGHLPFRNPETLASIFRTRQRAARFYSSCHWWCCVIEQFFVLFFFVLFSFRSYNISASAEHRADWCFWRCFAGANNMFSNFSKDSWRADHTVSMCTHENIPCVTHEKILANLKNWNLLHYSDSMLKIRSTGPLFRF